MLLIKIIFILFSYAFSIKYTSLHKSRRLKMIFCSIPNSTCNLSDVYLTLQALS